jgi:hypothetical protein
MGIGTILYCWSVRLEIPIFILVRGTHNVIFFLVGMSKASSHYYDCYFLGWKKLGDFRLNYVLQSVVCDVGKP